MTLTLGGVEHTVTSTTRSRSNERPFAPLGVTYADIEAAAARLEGVAHRTPVATSTQFDERAGCEAFFKCENFQRMGAFKFRGAYNTLAKLDARAAQARRGRVLLRQPRAGGGARRQAARRSARPS